MKGEREIQGEIAVFSDASETAAVVRRHLGHRFQIRCAPLSHLPQSCTETHAIIEPDLKNTGQLLRIRECLRHRASAGNIVFIAGMVSDLEAKRAYAVGATHVLRHPVSPAALLQIFDEPAEGGTAPPEASSAPWRCDIQSVSRGYEQMFSTVIRAERIDAAALKETSNKVVEEIEAQGLRPWVDTVRHHHSGTYQHCLLVTGIAVAFGQHLRCSRRDRQRLSLAAMLHDVGKAQIPVAILEKPAALDADELSLMRQHPRFGVEALRATRDLPEEMLDVVLHHHEYLDGSGYPDGLAGKDISDLVRMITIADVFGALVETRAYKPALSYQKAYAILQEMGGKLDRDLVREFRAMIAPA